MSELLSINVNSHTEKKGNLTYLSWAWAWAEVLKVDPQATWVVHKYGLPEQPCMWIGDTAMVHTSVTVKGLTRECMLPVMDHKNNAVKNPDARKISDAIMRCMTKAISMHGLGLYIYAGEDLPESDDPKPDPKPDHLSPQRKDMRASPTKLVADSVAGHISSDRKDDLAEDALKIVTAYKAMRPDDIMRIIDSIEDNDEYVYLWNLLAKETEIRSFIKATLADREKATA